MRLASRCGLACLFVEEAKRIFAYFDLDGSGTIDRNELQGLIFELGEVMTQEEVNFIFNAIDTGRKARTGCDYVPNLVSHF